MFFTKTDDSPSGSIANSIAPAQHKPQRPSLEDEMVPFTLIPEGVRPKRFVVALTGATGSSVAVRLLQALRALDIETHLIMSKWAATTLKMETDYSPDEVSCPSRCPQP